MGSELARTETDRSVEEHLCPKQQQKCIKVPEKEKEREVMLYERKTLIVVVKMFFTGRKISSHTRDSIQTDCRNCGMAMEEETAHHVVVGVVVVKSIRVRLYGKPLLPPETSRRSHFGK